MAYFPLLTDNPIFVRELRRRMRGRALIITLCCYVAAMCGWALLIVRSGSASVLAQQSGNSYSSFGGGSYTTVTTIGQNLSSWILAIQSILVLLVAPTLTAVMVRSEKERQTFDFLRATAISPVTYVVGALLSTVLYVGLALFCALPVLMISHLYGGVSDLLPSTVSLLCASLVLSSGGLMISCATEKGRSSHAVLALGLAAVGMWQIGALGWLRTPLQTASGSGTGLSASIGRIGMLLLVGGAASALMLLISARKLFHPEERALNYRQMTVLYGLGIAFAAWVVYAGTVQAALKATAGAPDPMIVAESIDILLLMLVGMGIVVQCTALLTRVEIGNELWRLKKRRAELRDREEYYYFTGALLGAGCAVAAAIILFAYPRIPSALPALFPVAAFLVFHAGLCRYIMKRVEDEFIALRTVLAIDAVLLIIPPILGVVSSQSSPVFDLFALFSMISPLEAARGVLRVAVGIAYKAEFATVVGHVIQLGLAMIAWTVASRAIARHENTHVNYDLDF